MIAFPAATALIAALCTALVGWDALRRPSPERVSWSVAFLLFTAAALSEVVGAAMGWTPTLARVFGSLSMSKLQALNAQIAVEGQPARDVAKRYLEQEGLLR